MKHIVRTKADIQLLNGIRMGGVPDKTSQPNNYRGLVVLKPWGYELQMFNSGECDVWLLCLKAGQATSMHCHPNKSSAFIPLTDGVTFVTLDGHEPLTDSIIIDKGVFHGQENMTDEDVFYLEHEWPADKTDIVRYADRYGRSKDAYEGLTSMIPLEDAGDLIDMPDYIKIMVGVAA